MELTFFDFSVFGIIAFFALIGLMRGLVKEIFSIINWVIASIATVYLRPIVSNLILMKIDIPILADLISNSFLFTTTLICISIITSNIARGIGNIFPAFVNILFGFVFGAFKGYILSALVFSIMLSVYGGVKNEPIWLVESATYQPLSLGADVVKPFTNSLFGSLTGGRDAEGSDDRGAESEENDEDGSSGEDGNEINNLIEQLGKRQENFKYIERASGKEDEFQANENIGYEKDQIKKIGRLIDTISD